MTDIEKNKSVQKFIFNDKVQNILSKINDNVMDFNILEITGMGSQEIKHSSILGWLFDDTEHNLEYQILDNFLKKVIKKNSSMNRKDILQSYLYLSNKKRDITIYREKYNIDLLIVDESNKIVITIENKVYADERIELANCDGEELGQLACYEKRINAKYNDDYDKYFIFLTIDLEQPSEKNDNWLRANHQIITEVIEDILKTKETTTKTKIVLESYVDLLKRNGIVEDEKLKDLCEKIWLNKEYSEALDILMQYKTTITKIFYENVLKKELNFFDNSVFLNLDGIEKLMNKFSLDYNKAIFDISCQYDKGDIILFFCHHKLSEESEEFQNICYEIKGKKSKTYEEIKKYTINDLRDKGEEFILKDIKEEIEKIEKRIDSLLKQ